jgi:predicted dehydrogenase
MAVAKQIAFAVVGLGSIAKSSVLPAFSSCKNAKLVAMVGREKRQAEALAKTYKSSAVYGSRELTDCLANPAVNAVYIATPQKTHLDLTTQAAKAGKHVLCEKPLALTVKQAEQMVQVCHSNGVLLMTAYRKYFEPSALYVRNLIREGALGSIDTVLTTFSELHVPGKSLKWLLDAKIAGGGPLMDLGVYCVNTTRWLLGEDPAEVTAQAWRNDKARFKRVEQGISFRMRFPSGTVMVGTTSYGAAISSLVFVQGTKGWISLTPAFPFDEERIVTGKIQGRGFQKKFPIVDEFAPEIDAFAKAILSRGKVEPDGEAGLRDMNIIAAIYEAARKQKSVAIRY